LFVVGKSHARRGQTRDGFSSRMGWVKRGLITSGQVVLLVPSFPCPPAWLSSCPPHHHHHRPVTHSVSSRLQAPPYAPLCCIKGVRFHSHANQNAANTHSRTRPPTVRATQGVEGLHTTSKSCGSHLQIESPSLLHTDGPPLSGTWVDGWMDGWRLCRVSLADNCPSWL
jgi:hypothetical protein